MLRFLSKAAIIGVLSPLLAVLLTGCSSLRLLYGNAEQFSWWWLDSYMDFSSEQAPQVKARIARFFQWHRATQAADYAALLDGAARQVTENTTPAEVCRWQQQARDRLEPALERAIDLSAELVPLMGEAQFRHLEQRYAKKNEEMKDDFLQPDRAQRQDKAVDRVVERFEQLYGRVGEAQRRVITAGVAASPFDAEAWLAERAKRQRETVATLRRLVRDKASRDDVEAALRALAERAESSPEPAYRAYQTKLADYNCAFAAQVHNATSAEQRQTARERLRGWAADLRAQAAEAASRPASPPAMAPQPAG